jgi:hypothetical protein
MSLDIAGPKEAQISGTELMLGAPEMSFEDARLAVLGAARQLQGLLYIHQVLNMPALAQKEVDRLEVRRAELLAEVALLVDNLAAARKEADDKSAALTEAVQGFKKQSAEALAQARREAMDQELQDYQNAK